jgi:hypothetical protein
MAEVIRGLLLIVVFAAYILGLTLWSPLFLFWPRRYEGMSYLETVATRWVLVRHIWTMVTRPLR